jgi:hypothetical protein
MKIIDCFPFFNEEHQLITRIRLLQDTVDRFVICEANRTHSGELKEYTCENILKKHGLLSDKICIEKVVLPSKKEEPDNWVRERMQRDSAMKLIQVDELWIISDCDEIPNPKILSSFLQISKTNPLSIVRIPMYNLFSRADLYLVNAFGESRPCFGPYICTNIHVSNYTLSDLRENGTTGKNLSFNIVIPVDPITNDYIYGGWHFTWMGSGVEKVKKLKAFAHCEEYIRYGIGQLSADSTRRYVENYIPKSGMTDVLKRVDHVLQSFPQSQLPTLILDDPFLKSYYLPEILHIYQNSNFGEDWFSYPKLYSEVVAKFPSRSKFVEVGSWKGKSSAYMAVEIANSGKDIDFYCVDTWKGSIEHQDHPDIGSLYDIFLENMEPVEGYFIPLHLTSEQASRKFKTESLDFVFIDASHEYEDVIKDLLLWYPKIKKGGVLAGHDYYPNREWGQDVFKAVHELFNNVVGTDENCFLIEK